MERRIFHHQEFIFPFSLGELKMMLPGIQLHEAHGGLKIPVFQKVQGIDLRLSHSQEYRRHQKKLHFDLISENQRFPVVVHEIIQIPFPILYGPEGVFSPKNLLQFQHGPSLLGIAVLFSLL
jgi:hypothetical protein